MGAQEEEELQTWVARAEKVSEKRRERVLFAVLAREITAVDQYHLGRTRGDLVMRQGRGAVCEYTFEYADRPFSKVISRIRFRVFAFCAQATYAASALHLRERGDIYLRLQHLFLSRALRR